MIDPARVTRLTAIADELDVLVARIDALYESRAIEWEQGRDVDGATSVELAGPSRVRDVTIRQALSKRKANA